MNKMSLVALMGCLTVVNVYCASQSNTFSLKVGDSQDITLTAQGGVNTWELWTMQGMPLVDIKYQLVPASRSGGSESLTWTFTAKRPGTVNVTFQELKQGKVARTVVKVLNITAN